MAKYVFIYTGGANTAPQQDWITWLRGLGDSVAESGYPFFGEFATVNSSGVTNGGASKADGYTIVNAASMAGKLVRFPRVARMCTNPLGARQAPHTVSP